MSGSGPIYTLTITPDGNDGTITIAIAAGVVTDVAGNASTASTNADNALGPSERDL
ncbi:MAG: Ig-like domain-containing protein [Arenicellales bacterium WSBS_2016_MAG_OTU3]